MARPKGGTNRKWSKDEKWRIVKRYFDEGIGTRTLGKEEGIEPAMIRNWIRRYLDKGESPTISKPRSVSY